jgi:hypothetical protein
LIAPFGEKTATKFKKLLGRSISIDETRVNMGIIFDISNALEGVAYLWKLTLRLLKRLSMQIFASSVRLNSRRYPSILIIGPGLGYRLFRQATAIVAVKLRDHSIVHPLVHDSLIRDKGFLKHSVRRDELNALWKLVQQNIDQADHILVNSKFVFVKDIFVHLGFDPSKTSVIY